MKDEKVPAPTVATDNKTKEHDCEFFLVTDVAVYACECDPHHILIDNQEYIPVASPVEEEQVPYSEQIEFVKAAFQYYVGYDGLDGFNKFLKESKFQITRKS